MREILVLFLAFIFSVCSDAQTIRLPAELEPQERVLLSLFGSPRRDSVTYREDQALLVSDIAVWLLPFIIFWSYWLIKDKRENIKLIVE